MSIETVLCDQACGASLFKFADVSTCPDCSLRLARAAMAAQDKAAQWDAAMAWLDGLPVKYPLNSYDSLVDRLDDLWRQLWDS